MLVQVEGSHHDWLEDRGPRLVLLIAANDATGNIPYVLFRHEEDAQGYFLLLQGISSAEAFPWPSTATAAQSSSIHASLARRQPDRPSSPALCKSWV